VAGPAGASIGALVAVRQGAGDPDPTIGVASHLPDCQAALAESRQQRQDRRPHRLVLAQGLDPLGSTSDSRAYASPVITRIRTSSSVPDRSEPAPRMILLQSFIPVNMQAILDRCCRGAMRRLRKSPSTIMDVRPPLARVLTRSSTGSSSAGRDGLSFQQLRSRRDASVGSSRRSLASVMAMTQSLR
jgi:hypothetical protein